MNHTDFISVIDPRKYIDFFSSHSILYILGVLFLITIFVLEEVFGLMTYTGKAIALMFSIDTSHERVKQMIQAKADEKKNKIHPMFEPPKVDEAN